MYLLTLPNTNPCPVQISILHRCEGQQWKLRQHFEHGTLQCKGTHFYVATLGVRALYEKHFNINCIPFYLIILDIPTLSAYCYVNQARLN